MARSDPAESLHIPSRVARRPLERDDGDERPRLRLVVAKGRLAAELERPFTLAPLRLEALTLLWPDVGFPVELTGGVQVFRHRRGVLEQLEVSLPAAAGQAWASGKLRRADRELREVVLAPLEDGWLLGACSRQAALAAEVVLAPLEGDLRLVVASARGLGLAAPPQAVAGHLLARLLKPWGRALGGAVVIERAAEQLARQLLPLAGVRVPATEAVHFSCLRFDIDGVTLRAEHEASLLPLSPRVSAVLELATLAAAAEHALAGGDLELARREYLAALSAAPRHPELTRRLAELDSSVGGRDEAALSCLAEACPPVDAGAIGAVLLEGVGDVDGAREAMRRAAEREPYGPLAALGWQHVSRLSEDPQQATAALDEAVVRAPVLSEARWQRFERRLDAGRMREARADLQQLEAAASGARDRHQIWRRAADRMLEARLADEAATAYERALRYAPASVPAVSGLAEALASLGHRQRALQLYRRAAALAERAGRKAHDVALRVAELLVEVAGDRPAAISRVRSVPAFVRESFQARLLEARWRAEIGDLAGAGDALARLAQAAETAMDVLVGRQPPEPAAAPALTDLFGEPPEPGGEAARRPSRHEMRAAVAAWLEEGARIEEIDRGDLRAARRLLALAVQLAPQHRRIGRAFRRVAALIDGAGGRPAHAASTPGPAASAEHAGAAGASEELAADSDAAAQAEQRVEQLGELLRARPDDEPLVRELLALLTQLGRDHELLALLTARLEQSAGGERVALAAQRRATLERLSVAAQQAGRHDEAALYRELLAEEA